MTDYENKDAFIEEGITSIGEDAFNRQPIEKIVLRQTENSVIMRTVGAFAGKRCQAPAFIVQDRFY